MNERDPRMGKTALLTPDDVFDALPAGVTRISVIGCDSQRFKAALAVAAPNATIVYTDFPFEMQKAGTLRFVNALKKGSSEHKGTLKNIIHGYPGESEEKAKEEKEKPD